MNIFVVDSDPVAAARALCDKHVPKMITETAQLLSAPFGRSAAESPAAFAARVGAPGVGPYSATSRVVRHRCAAWARASSANYAWLVAHGRALVEEQIIRYRTAHASEAVIEWCAANIGERVPRVGPRASPPPAVVSEAARLAHPGDSWEDVVAAYREYYLTDKRSIARWSRSRPPPDWWT